jgi:hypothetical protein
MKEPHDDIVPRLEAHANDADNWSDFAAFSIRPPASGNRGSRPRCWNASLPSRIRACVCYFCYFFDPPFDFPRESPNFCLLL